MAMPNCALGLHGLKCSGVIIPLGSPRLKNTAELEKLCLRAGRTAPENPHGLGTRLTPFEYGLCAGHFNMFCDKAFTPAAASKDMSKKATCVQCLHILTIGIILVQHSSVYLSS